MQVFRSCVTILLLAVAIKRLLDQPQQVTEMEWLEQDPFSSDQLLVDGAACC